MPQRAPASRPWLFIVVSGIALFAASAGTARAADECIVKPNADPPSGQHWYYRTDREANRQCWYLGPEGVGIRKTATTASRQIEPDAPGPTLTQQQREALFRKFIEWRQNQAAQRAQ